MENNEIMQMLMEEETSNTSSTSKAKNLIANHTHRDEDLAISKVRVVTAKYKIFIIALIIVILAIIFVYEPAFRTSHDNAVSSYKSTQNQLKDIESKIKIAGEDKKFLAEIVENEITLKKCLNDKNNQACDSLKQKWYKDTGTGTELDYTIPLSFHQLQSLHSEKMAVDEKMVLKNLNEYLIKHNMSSPTRDTISGERDILKVSLGEPEIIGYRVKETPTGNPNDPIKKENIPNFFQVPVEVSIKFKDVDNLVEFLYNIEKRIIENPEDRILYKIQSVSYDIISNDESQITDIEMIAYYYYDERFNDSENVEVDDQQTTTSNTQTNQTAEKKTSNEQKKTDDNSQAEEQKAQTTTIEQKKENKVESFFSNLFSK